MKSQIFNYSNYDKDLKKDEEILDSIFEKLSKNKEEAKSLQKLEQLLKSKIDFKKLLPSSKSYEGENLLTLSKLWMILILIKITRGKKQQEDFLTLVNSSLTHDLNEYEEYRQFFEDQCEQLFSDDEAINIINKNPRKEKQLEKPSAHEEIRSNYIYLLYRPEYFKKIKLDGISKMKKIENKQRRKTVSRSSNKSKSGIEDTSNVEETEEIDEKGDRLDENDMLSKIRINKQNKNKRGKSNTTSFKRKPAEDNDDKEDKDKKDSNIKKRNKSNKKIDRRRKKKEESEEEPSDEEIVSDKEEESSKDRNKKRGRKPK